MYFSTGKRFFLCLLLLDAGFFLYGWSFSILICSFPEVPLISRFCVLPLVVPLTARKARSSLEAAAVEEAATVVAGEIAAVEVGGVQTSTDSPHSWVEH